MSKFKVNDWVLDDEDTLFQVKRVRDNEIALTDEPFYVPAKEYRLKEKEDEMRDRENNSGSSEFGDGDDNNVDIDKLQLNNFQDYGFTADFKGEILTIIGNHVYTIFYEQGRDYPAIHDLRTGQRIDRGYKSDKYNLTPISVHI